jgi:hypothetical protein
MSKRTKIKIDSARESLEDILRRIQPYIPKTPERKEEKQRDWRPIDAHTFPPIPSSGRVQLI